MAKPERVRLAAGPFTAELCPEIGGALTRFQGWGMDLLRPAHPDALVARDPLGMSCYLLIPFSNRVRNARFTFEGRSYELARNFGAEPNAIHGNGWQRAWQVEETAAAAARLVLVHDPARDGAAAWPFAYRATEEVALAGDGLDIRLTIENADTRRMPAGLGVHPFFPLTMAARLTARLGGVWLAEGHEAVPPAWNFAHGAPVAPLSVDHCFTGWTGPAVLEWPERRLRLTIAAAPLLRNLVIYVPRAHDYVCVEPVSNVNDGFNLAAAGVPDTGVVVLAPGEKLSASVKFRPERLSRA